MGLVGKLILEGDDIGVVLLPGAGKGDVYGAGPGLPEFAELLPSGRGVVVDIGVVGEPLGGLICPGFAEPGTGVIGEVVPVDVG